RHRQRLLRRDPPPRAPLAPPVDLEALGRGAGAPVRGDPDGAHRMDGAPPGRSRRGVPGEGHRLPSPDGGARSLPGTLPGMRLPGAADRARGERNQLLCALSDRRPAPGGSRALQAPQGRLAQDARRAGGGERLIPISDENPTLRTPVVTIALL